MEISEIKKFIEILADSEFIVLIIFCFIAVYYFFFLKPKLQKKEEENEINNKDIEEIILELDRIKDLIKNNQNFEIIEERINKINKILKDNKDNLNLINENILRLSNNLLKMINALEEKKLIEKKEYENLEKLEEQISKTELLNIFEELIEDLNKNKINKLIRKVNEDEE